MRSSSEWVRRKVCSSSSARSAADAGLAREVVERAAQLPGVIRPWMSAAFTSASSWRPEVVAARLSSVRAGFTTGMPSRCTTCPAGRSTRWNRTPGRSPSTARGTDTCDRVACLAAAGCPTARAALSWLRAERGPHASVAASHRPFAGELWPADRVDPAHDRMQPAGSQAVTDRLRAERRASTSCPCRPPRAGARPGPTHSAAAIGRSLIQPSPLKSDGLRTSPPG